MLKPCPECQLQVSDRAITCPHCGYPLKEPNRQRISKKRKALPNGFGQISFIKGNLRKPYRAMISVGKHPNGRPMCKILKPQGYFETYNEAYAALVEYHKNPYDIKPDVTVADVYEKWSEAFYPQVTESRMKGYKAAWKYCEAVYNMQMKDLRVRHIKGCLEEGTNIVNGVVRHPTDSMKKNIKILFSKLFEYALEYEIVDKNYAKMFNITNTDSDKTDEKDRSHIPFTDSEMHTLWAEKDTNRYIKVILFQCYTGFRPQELGRIEIKNINLDTWIITGGMKTSSGRNRIVPIHPDIREITKEFYDEAVRLNSEYLINCYKTHRKNTQYFMSYDKYNYRFELVIKDYGLNPKHSPHDPRVHFATMADAYHVDRLALKDILGHSVNDVTDKCYIKHDEKWLMNEICKISPTY